MSITRAQGTQYQSITGAVDLSSPLQDLPASGRRAQPWAAHRAAADLLAYAYASGTDRHKAARVMSCAPRLLFERRAAADGRLLPPSAPGALHLRSAWFCRVRLCPVCQWRRSLMIYGQAMQVVRRSQQLHPGIGWIALTLTTRNCTATDLPQTITHMLRSWQRLTRQASYTRTILGALRSMEITRNMAVDSPHYGTYHPHIHALVAVPAVYWHKRYISRAGWAAMWQQAMRTDYTPQVWVQRVRGDAAPAIAEVCKYATKPGAYITPDDLDAMIDSVRTLDRALHRRRLIAWQGILKTIHAELALPDPEDGDLIHTDPDATDDADTQHTISYSYVQAQHNYYADR